MAKAAGAAVYASIGIALYNIIPSWWSFTFAAIVLVAIVCIRMASIFGLYFCSLLCCKHKGLQAREIGFISFGGMVRGVIAYALA
jgi:NhaP-type Na+/H+ or K+/H+ antiporter